ncbi:hypothetical protein ACGFT2_06145 [Streptomyces sp. NPDC048514]|uniref:hypothetical protein n=1 Tax=Streptomyces sp. NPDC048514 TaxID=3365564 RepID=UPI003715E2C1
MNRYKLATLAALIGSIGVTLFSAPAAQADMGPKSCTNTAKYATFYQNAIWPYPAEIFVSKLGVWDNVARSKWEYTSMAAPFYNHGDLNPYGIAWSTKDGKPNQAYTQSQTTIWIPPTLNTALYVACPVGFEFSVK